MSLHGTFVLVPERNARRPTIADVAARAGVSKMAVSFALNDRAGVSDATRLRVLAAADELRWRPNSAARSLSGDRARAVGLVLVRPADALGVDTFYMRLFAGLEAELSLTSTSLLLHVAADHEHGLELLRTLVAERRVDALLVSDVEVDDPRIPLLRELGAAAVVLGGPADGLPVLRSDDQGAMDQVLDHLGELGHTRVARIAGSSGLHYTRERTTSFLASAQRRGMLATVREDAMSAASIESATLELLAAPEVPTAFVFDSDMLALAGMDVFRRRGMGVPEDVSVVAWDGSILCEVARPTLTSVKRDVFALGSEAARQLLRAADGLTKPGFLADGHDLSQPHLVVAGSTNTARR